MNPWKGRGRFGFLSPGLVFLSIAFLASVIAVNPLGNFPLDDDFAYGKTVKNLYETGQLRIHGWISATVVFQTLVGYVFSLPFGFSFTALRFSSLLLAFIGACAAYYILKELGADEKRSIAGSMLLLFNPLYFNKAFNFHSDIHFMSMLLLAALFYIKAIKRNNDLTMLFLGSLFTVFAILIRQNGLFITLAVSAYLWLNRKNKPFAFRHFTVVVLFPLFAFSLYAYWFYFVHGVTESGSLMTEYDLPHILDLVFRLVPFRMFSIFIYSGLLLLPLTLPRIWGIRRFFGSLVPFDKALLSISIIAGVAGAVFLYFGYGKLLFYLPTTIHSRGIGPVYLLGDKLPEFHAAALALVSAAAIISGAVILTRMRARFRLKAVSARSLVYIVGAFQLGFLMLVLAVFDRYLLPIFFPLIAFLTMEKKQLSGITVAAIILMAAFSVAGTQDYLSWNRARYDAINGLMESGIPADRIDGGFEHAAWHFYEYSRAHPEINVSRPDDPGWIRDYFPVIDSKYRVSFSQLEGYRVLESYNYFSMLTMKSEKIYSLERV